MNKLKVFLQYITPQHTLTKAIGLLANCRWGWVKNIFIGFFIKIYDVNLKEAVIENPYDYPDFNSFFTRYLKKGVRTFVTESNQIASPCDGCVSQIGKINQQSLLQAKGVYFNLTNLLGGSEERANPFINGHFGTFYLAPKDYHRVHMPFSGTLKETVYIPGRLFSVNQNTTRQVPSLFARNERLVCIFDTEMGPMAIILVGAMIVGSINTVWHSQKTPEISVETFDGKIKLNRGDELGHFKLGSTVILLFKQDAITWSDKLVENSALKLGEEIAFINANSG